MHVYGSAFEKETRSEFSWDYSVSVTRLGVVSLIIHVGRGYSRDIHVRRGYPRIHVADVEIQKACLDCQTYFFCRIHCKTRV